MPAYRKQTTHRWQLSGSIPATITGCPTSRSFFARCGIPQAFPSSHPRVPQIRPSKIKSTWSATKQRPPHPYGVINTLTTTNAFHWLQCDAPCLREHSLATKVESSSRPVCILSPVAAVARFPDLVRLVRTFLHADPQGNTHLGALGANSKTPERRSTGRDLVCSQIEKMAGEVTVRLRNGNRMFFGIASQPLLRNSHEEARWPN
jgi:hypothetical protein